MRADIGGVPGSGDDVSAPAHDTGDAGASLGRRLRSQRLAAGLSVDEMARRAGIVPGYYGEIERGRKTPSTRVMQRLAGALHLSLAELLEGDDPVPELVPLHPRRALLQRLFETSSHLDTESLHTLLDFAGYLAQARGGSKRGRVGPATSFAPAPLFPEDASSAP